MLSPSFRLLPQFQSTPSASTNRFERLFMFLSGHHELDVVMCTIFIALGIGPSAIVLCSCLLRIAHLTMIQPTPSFSCLCPAHSFPPSMPDSTVPPSVTSHRHSVVALMNANSSLCMARSSPQASLWYSPAVIQVQFHRTYRLPMTGFRLSDINHFTH